MLLELADECKQHIWVFLSVQDLCRVACVARNAEQGVCLGPIWHRHSRELLAKGQEALRGETGVLGFRLQRGLASRNLLAPDKQQIDVAISNYEEEEMLSIPDTFDWKLWYRDTHLVRSQERRRVFYHVNVLTIFTCGCRVWYGFAAATMRLWRR
jgi:hypothetical protein